MAAGGIPAQGEDFLDRLFRWFPLLVGAVLAVTAVVLLGAFRSVLLPVKAALLNCLPTSLRAGISLATGLVHSSTRPYRWIGQMPDAHALRPR